jgi:uncharacterized protein YndB with AHSA1/START domain
MNELSLHLERIVPATRPLVFRAHVHPEWLARWWGPKGFTSPSVEFDPHVGRSYRIAMQPPTGELFYLTGEFREVDAPSRLAYTFRWEEPDPDDQETIVSVSFHDRGDSTLLTVDQGVFATESRRALHQQGWTESLDRLEELIAGREWRP